MFTPLIFLSLTPFLSTIYAQSNPSPKTIVVTTTIQATTSTSTVPKSSTPSKAPTTTAVNPTSARSKFFQDYASYYKAQATNPLFKPSFLSSPIPATQAQAQENSYLAALMTITSGTVLLPPYITALPPDQQSYMRSLHAYVASIASVDYGRPAVVQDSTTTLNETVIAGPSGSDSTTSTSSSQEPTTTSSQSVSSPSPSVGNATDGNDKEGEGSPILSAGAVYRMTAGVLVGMLGVAVFL
ncbi:MAG: hypothetical protein L6R41_001741 [Letrouitia leprolyta]|nr:MAG: hypothetical protein L6R41_001741 [Letrouitia leprolyta]